MTIYVGNINYSLGETDIQRIFEVLGTVEFVKMVIDRKSGKSKGYAFVEMPNPKEGEEAIKALDSKEVAGRNLRVMKAHSIKKTIEVEVESEQ